MGLARSGLCHDIRRGVRHWGCHEVCNELRRVQDVHGLRRNILRVLGEWGFSDFCYQPLGVGTEKGTGAGVEADLVTVTPAQLDIYRAEAFSEHDIFLQYIYSNTHPIYLSSFEEFLSAASFTTDYLHYNRELIRMIKSFGYRDWYIMPLHGFKWGPAVFSVSIKNADATTIHHKVAMVRRELQAFGQAIDEVYSAKFHSSLMLKNTLNPRPAQVLQELASGSCVSLRAISNKLCISIDTVNQHIATAKSCLGATSTYHAISIALERGLIRPASMPGCSAVKKNIDAGLMQYKKQQMNSGS